MDALCQWCRLGAYANDHNPDEIESIDFNGHLLAVWRESGEAIADREDAEARQAINAEPADYDADRIERNIDDQDERGTGFDRASWGAC